VAKVRRHKCVIQQPTDSPTPNTRGDEQSGTTWADWKMVYASIEPLAGREIQFAQQIHGNVSHKITFRYVSGMSTRMRIKWNNRYFNLAPTLNDEEANVEITVYATEKK